MPAAPHSWYHADVRRCLLKRFVVWPLIVVLGGQWAGMRGLAWATMLARFSQTMPLAQAAQYTFDGNHPCPLCTAAAAGQQAERKKGKLKSEPLLLGLSPEPPLLPPPPPAGAACP